MEDMMNSTVIQIISKRFSKHVSSAALTEFVGFSIAFDTPERFFQKKDSVLFKAGDIDDFCFLQFGKAGEPYTITLLTTSVRSFQALERDCLDYGVSFRIADNTQLETIINCFITRHRRFMPGKDDKPTNVHF
jgi:hypothetical protein